MQTANGTFTCPEFLRLEHSIISDFMACTRECRDDVENCITELDKGGGGVYIHQLFRALHSLKGNCQMVGLVQFGQLLHHVEEMIAPVRASQVSYLPELGEFLLLVTDEIASILQDLTRKGEASEIQWQQLFNLCAAIERECRSADRANQLLHASAVLKGKLKDANGQHKSQKVLLELPKDMDLMHTFALLIENLSIYSKGRSDQVVQLTASINEALGFPLNVDQLKVASCMHDIGMAFIPHSIFNKEGALSKEEVRKIQEHVVTGSQLLLRFSDWDDAARMILDHHEKFDGSGYPNGLAGSQIHLGARMLSIVDAFCSMTNERSDRSFKKSLLSAISEINANSHSQFDPELVNTFNEVVRKIMMK